MTDKELKRYFQQPAEGIAPQRMEETVRLCIEITREQIASPEEPRLGFFGYLSDIFRFDGISILGLQAVTLFFTCLIIYTVLDIPENIPIFMPLFILAAMPVLFRGQYYGTSEIEAATRTSGAQIVLAKLILAGAANLICITVILCLEVYLQNSCSGLGQMILYCLVPYLMCMIILLRSIRLKKKDSIPFCIVVMLSSCVFWGGLARAFPWLYQTSAIGAWIIAVLLFTIFYIKEVCFIVEMRKEGKMYGIIA